MTRANTKGLKYSATWVMSGTAAQVLSQIVAIVVLARLLTPYEFGVVSAAALVTQLLVIFSEFGVGPYVVQRAQLSERFIGTAYVMSCCLGMSVAALLFFGAPLAAALLHVQELEAVLRAYAVVPLMTGAIAVHDALIQREMDYKHLARADAVSFSIGYAAVSIGCALLGFSYWSLVIGHLSQALIRCSIIRMRYSHVSRSPASLDEVKHIAHFGLGQTLSRLASFVATQADGFIVTSRLGVAAMGIYGRANQLVTMPTAQLGQIFDKLIFPLAARSQHEQTRAATMYRTALAGICVLSLPVSALLWFLGEKIVHLALGSQWIEVVEPLRILALAIPFRLIHKVSDPMARAMGKTYSRAWRQWLVAAVVVNLTLILSDYGLAAVAWGIVAAAILDAALMVWLCCAVTKLPASELPSTLVPGTRAGVLVAAVAGVVTFSPGPWQQSDFFSVMLAGIVSMSAIALLLRRYPLKVR